MLKILDPNFYKKFYPELKNFDNKNLEKHYKLYGLNEGHLINQLAFLKKYPDFNYQWYTENIEHDILDIMYYYHSVIINIKMGNFYIGQPIITFILPTIGRNHLIKSIYSVYSQTISNWNLLIIFDGIKSTINNPKLIKDKRIKILTNNCKLGQIKPNHNNAGKVRNFGFGYINSSEWIGFIDDDDLLEPFYIESLIKEADNDVELIIFKMRHSRNKNLIVPPNNCTTIIKNKVGISFCFKRKLLEKYNLKFVNDENEDYLFLMELLKLGIKYKISNKITYIFN
jgi:hypothetical protein